MVRSGLKQVETMSIFSVTFLRRLRPSVGAPSSSLIYSAAAHRAPPPCSRRQGGGPGADGRSFLRCHSTLCSVSSRCLSTATHSEDGKLIYSGSLGTAVRGVKLFSYSSSWASLLVMPQILLKTGLGVQSLALQAAFCGVVGFFTFITPVVLHFITKGYVIRLYHSPDRDTYTAITYSVFLTEKRRVFHQRKVRIPAVSQMFTTFYAGDAGLLVNPDMFLLPHDYNHLMGYDKPFSFSTDDVDRPDQS
ncbi:transmembrane protein 70, mitochondrial isoform X2 [Trematomus bernacchii]|uniref:transmembrane protein 70, mitochondrial isoform X2 n=1 Tax=Trematomus bernacchii TaxID=40690 RepID=UPI00146DFB36|nr:transmembrane protein 70, mitochondrial isoform X2 [Trematomus bernacchii]